MKNIILCLISLILILGCNQSEKLKVVPDYSGTYSGAITKNCNTLNPKPENATAETQDGDIVIIKTGNNYVLKDLDNMDLEFQLEFNDSQGGFAFGIPTYTVGNITNSWTGVFTDSVLTITGGSLNTDAETIKCSNKFVGIKK